MPEFDNPALLAGLRAALIGIMLGVVFIAAAFALPGRLSGGHAGVAPAE